ncbi:MAG: hypothetical protein IT426_16315 [Pirellulales bacterium]|nr:hypothetical protein [Pirellulales bacterium]
MLKFTVSVVALSLILLLAGPAFADGYGSHRGGPPHGAYYHGGHGYHGGYGYGGYAPSVYRPRVVYSPVPYVYPRPVIVAPVYRPVYPGYGCYGAPGGSLYLQGRNFSFGVGF